MMEVLIKRTVIESADTPDYSWLKIMRKVNMQNKNSTLREHMKAETIVARLHIYRLNKQKTGK